MEPFQLARMVPARSQAGQDRAAAQSRVCRIHNPVRSSDTPWALQGCDQSYRWLRVLTWTRRAEGAYNQPECCVTSHREYCRWPITAHTFDENRTNYARLRQSREHLSTPPSTCHLAKCYLVPFRYRH